MNRRERRRRREQSQRDKAREEGAPGLPVPLSDVRRDAVDAGVDAELIERQDGGVRQVRGNVPAERRQVMMQSASYAGPIPPPGLLKAFDDVVPGSADRIITQFEEQGRHRRKQEDRVIASNISQAARGQILAFIIFMTVALGGGFLIYVGRSIEGSGALFTGVASAIWALRGARKAKEEDLASKRSTGKAERRKR